MVRVYKLTKRHVDTRPREELPLKYQQILIFSSCVGHGVGTLDFSELVLTLQNDEFEEILSEGDKYAKFKLGNLNKFGEIEIFKEHANELLKSVKNEKFKNVLNDLNEGYLVLRKDFYE